MSDPAIPPYEKQIILSHVLKKPREYVLMHPEINLTKAQQKKYRFLVAHRLRNEPLAYILGEKGFYGLDFRVSRHTLIPRPETEHLVDATIGNLKLVIGKRKKISIIDVGTGSGNIIISIAKEIESRIKYNASSIMYFGTDISEKALRIAKFNAKKHKLNNLPTGRIKFIRSNLLDVFIQNTRYQIQNTNLNILANLPYLSKKIYKNTALDIKKYEPRLALLSGTDGLNHYRKLLKQIKLLKNKYPELCITCCIEFSPEQKLKISRLIKFNFPKSNSRFIKDLTQRWRIAVLKI